MAALFLAFGQAVPVQSVESAQLERIRKALAGPAPIATSTTTDVQGRPVFRVNVQQRADVWLWTRPNGVPRYVFPPMTGLHYEFLNQVTPEYFRASTIYPVGLPVGSFLRGAVKAIKAERQRRREVSAREEVRRAIEEWNHAHGK